MQAVTRRTLVTIFLLSFEIWHNRQQGHCTGKQGGKQAGRQVPENLPAGARPRAGARGSILKPWPRDVEQPHASG